jgi:hypothetical protein
VYSKLGRRKIVNVCTYYIDCHRLREFRVEAEFCVTLVKLFRFFLDRPNIVTPPCEN